MIRFSHIEYLYLLLLVPILLLGYWVVSRKRRNELMQFSSLPLLQRLAGDFSERKRSMKFSVVVGAVALICLGLANPKVGTRLEEVKQEGVDLFIALDVSLSMKAEDVKPNRLQKAKYEINNLINRLQGDRIGLIIFSGEAFVQFPLTTDYSAANLFLDVVDVETVPTPGTAIGSAMQRAMKSFNFEEPTQKVLVIITDGENNEGDAVSQAEEASKKGILIFTIGMGSPAGAPIPFYDAGGRQVDFKRDRTGNIVLTKLDELSLQQIASVGKGKYYRATNAQDELDAIYKDINALQKREFGTKQFTDFEDQFQYFIGGSLLLLLLDLLLSDRKTAWLAKLNPFRTIEAEEKSFQ